MNQIFVFRRFGRLFGKSILERPMAVSGTLLMAFGSTFLCYFFFASMGAYHPAQDLSFAIGLVGGSCLMASIAFGYFSSEATGISYLTLPVSNFEKWLVGVLITALYLGLFLAYFRLLDNFFVGIYHSRLNPKDPRYADQYAAVWQYSFSVNREFWTFFLIALCGMLLGGIHFNRMSFVKTALVVIGMLFAIFLLNSAIAHFLLPGVQRAQPFVGVVLTRGDGEASISLPAETTNRIFLLNGLGYPLVILFASYLKLREKQI